MATDGKVRHESIFVLNIARGVYWQKLIDDGTFKNNRELANALDMDVSYIARTIRLSRLSPKIIHALIAGKAPEKLNIEQFRNDIPELWSKQERLFVG